MDAAGFSETFVRIKDIPYRHNARNSKFFDPEDGRVEF
jgi:hypothetical protein